MILVIGDIHIKQNNLTLIDVLIQQLHRICVQRKPDQIVLLGDILHDHSRLFTPCLNKALALIYTLREFARVIIIVGNHDMCSGALYLTQDHWMNPLKEWSDVTIVDSPIQIGDNVFVPYVPPGRFLDALNVLVGWESAKMIFCHQEFRGCHMGMIVSQDGDEWDGRIRIVSGHIHGSQTLPNNIYYVGSSTPTTFSETGERHVLLIDKTEEEIPIDLPKKVTLTKKISEIDEIDGIKDLRIRVNGTEVEYKTFKKSKKYKDLIQKGVKIVFNPPKTESNMNVKNQSFAEIFSDEIKKLDVNERVQAHIIKYRKKIGL